MSGPTENRSLLGKRKKKRTPSPNPLFCKWLAEWRDEAKEKGWKSEFIYSKALKSLQKFPLPLVSGKDCKVLQHFGDKICKMLDDRLLQHRKEQGGSGLAGDVVLPASDKQRKCPKFSAPVHAISDSSDEDSGCSKLSSHSAPKYSRTDIGHTAVCADIDIGPLSSDAQNGFHDSIVLSDEELSIIEEKSFVKSINGSLPANNFDFSANNFNSSDDVDDLPVLLLPDLQGSNAEKENKKKGECVKRARTPKGIANGQNSSLQTEGAEILGEDGVRVHVETAVGDGGCRDSFGDCDGNQAQPGQRNQGRGGPRQREYVPAYRSGPYAILLTLYRHAQNPDFRGFMTKAELCRSAQPLADKSFTVPDPGSRYTAWSSVSALIKKGFLIKESSPAKFRLTDAGYELGRRLEEAEQQQAVGLVDGNDGDGGAGGCGDGGGQGGDLATQRCQKRVKAPCGTDEMEHNAPLVDEREQTENLPQDDIGHLRSKSAESAPVTHTNVYISDDSDDDLPALPSLAQRLKPQQTTELLDSPQKVEQPNMADKSNPSASEDLNSAPAAMQSSENRLHYWYVAEGDKLVRRKDQACVTVDEEIGVGFLVKVNYQQLLSSGKQYKLDILRPLGDDFVFAYLGDAHCEEEAFTPTTVQHILTSDLVSTTVKQPKLETVVQSRKKPVHEISDSDSDPESLPSIDIPVKSSALSEVQHQAASSKLEAKLLSEAAPARTAGAPVKVPSLSGCLPRVPSLSGSQDSVDSVSSVASNSTAGEPVPDFVLRPGTFEVVLCVDNREFYGSNSSSKRLLPDLIKNGVTCDLRLLNVGDLLWVAREKAKPGTLPGSSDVSESTRRELVLNYVVERKRMDDLVSSMIGGRLKEQKFRLKHCSLQEKIILIESYGSMQHFSISEDRIRQAIANSEIIDGFTVKQTRDSKETAAYLTLMTRYLQSYYQNKTLRSCSRDGLKVARLTFQPNDSEQMLMPFEHFNQAAMKTKPLTVRELFAKQLIQLWGMSADKAKGVVNRYPTPTSLMQAYAACTTDKERDSLLANVKYGKNLRNLGIAVSRQLALLYTSKKLV